MEIEIGVFLSLVLISVIKDVKFSNKYKETREEIRIIASVKQARIMKKIDIE